jgi:hypothetical protein
MMEALHESSAAFEPWAADPVRVKAITPAKPEASYPLGSSNL